MFLPNQIREVYYIFKDIFDDLGIPYTHACALLLMHFLGITKFCELARTCPWSGSVSTLAKYSGFFNSNRFMKRNLKRVLDTISQSGHCEYCFAIDDTANPKYGSACFRSNSFGSSGGKYFGQKILVLALIDMRTRRAFPLQYAFLTGKKDPDHLPANVVAIELLHHIIDYGYPPFPVTADSWFDSKEFIQSVHELGCDFAGELKSTRNIKNNPGPNNPVTKLKKWFKNKTHKRLPLTKYQKRAEKRGKSYCEDILYITGLGRPLKIIAVYNRINGASAFAYYATTNLTMTGSQLWKYSRGRWAIEVMFRDLKQSLSFGRLTAGGEEGANLSVCIPLILYASIQTDSKKIWDFSGKDSIGTLVKKVREIAFSKSLDHIINQPNGPKLKMLKARRKNPNQKPTNICGEQLAA